MSDSQPANNPASSSDASTGGASADQSPRLIIDSPSSAAWNMALDQAILDSVSAGAGPVLRFYEWDVPTLSLGYFQSLGDRSGHSASHSIPVVRRSTGGGAIVHHHELTYSLTLPITDRAATSVQRIYDRVHSAIRNTMLEFGVALERAGQRPAPPTPPFLCFQRRAEEDLLCAGYKVGGSAQRRTARAVLQHGSLLLNVSQFAPELPGITDLSGRHIQRSEIYEALCKHLPPQQGPPTEWVKSSPFETELKQADNWVEKRFTEPGWLNRRP